LHNLILKPFKNSFTAEAQRTLRKPLSKIIQPFIAITVFYIFFLLCVLCVSAVNAFDFFIKKGKAFGLPSSIALTASILS